ncbi:hypothetical protein EVJ58_g1740 [Rhodofomes roseus]|uniref:tripeptidyl-peptidase II n=1 Tax=Rhodofomes roseus TaxID=34475 RepID=A0A4Y9YZP2_9APHY|nr:hypothetical protein EVJ58_g1740 [Rhodofomes roseus]
MIKLRVALVQSNPAGLEDALYDVSTPSSDNYGQYLTREEAAAFVAPSDETTSAVNTWLAEHEVAATPLTPAGDWIGFTVPVSKANEMFAADYSVYAHTETGQTAIRTLSYSVPEELIEHLKVLYPSTTFPKVQRKLQVVKAPVSVVPETTQGAENAAVNASCASTITPSCLQQIYGVPSSPATQSSNKLAVAGYDDQWSNIADLSVGHYQRLALVNESSSCVSQTFLKRYRPDMSSNTSFTLETLDGGSNNQTEADAGVEANLDIQYTVGVATNVPTVFISAGENNNDGDLGGFLDMTDLLLNETNPPQVWTTSYGPNEDDVPEDLAYNLCNAYAQLGARGVSILFATGDGGVSGTQSSECTTFVVPFPDGCPYMTNVGSTTGFAPEISASFSSGGFSNYWARPSYQADAVEAYLKTLGGHGINFSVVIDQEFYLVDGTSCSSPTFASVVSLLNDELVGSGKPVLGFLNPWLYSTAAGAFNDITEGSNPGCGTDGFNATAGWDPVTGLGSPDYAKLRSAAGLS